MEAMEGRAQDRQREGSLRSDLEEKRSRHDSFRSSIFSTTRRDRSRSSFSRGFATAAAATGIASFVTWMSGSQDSRSKDEGLGADPEGVRAVIEMGASSGSSAWERGGSGGGAGCEEKTADWDERGIGGAERGEGGTGGVGDALAPDPYKGKHWSSVADACFLSRQPPSQKAGALVAARSAEVSGGEGRHNRKNGSGAGRGGGRMPARDGGGTAAPVIAGDIIGRFGNDGVDGAFRPASTAAVAAAASPTEVETTRPRPKTVWERGGAPPPARRTLWKEMIARSFSTLSSRWNRGTGDPGEVHGVAPGWEDGERTAPGLMSAVGRCLLCCGSRGNDGISGSSSSSSSRSGGGGGVKAAATLLGIGLFLEVAATLWAFRQAARAGALAGRAAGGDGGTTGLAVAALAVALAGQAVEAAAGVACLKNPLRSGAPALLAGAAAIQGIGVVALAWALTFLLPGAASTPTHEEWVVWVVVAVAMAGVLLEAVSVGCTHPATGLPFLGASGHALLRLGAAALEVLVALFLVREGGGEGSETAEAGRRETLAAALKDGEMVGLVAVEAAATLAVWAARALWTRARLVLAVKGLEGPSRRRSANFARFDSV
eukprot:g1577.t1